MPDDPMSQYLATLARLERLIADGRCDSPEADAIRDELDPLWRALSDEERDRICHATHGDPR